MQSNAELEYEALAHSDIDGADNGTDATKPAHHGASQRHMAESPMPAVRESPRLEQPTRGTAGTGGGSAETPSSASPPSQPHSTGMQASAFDSGAAAPELSFQKSKAAASDANKQNSSAVASNGLTAAQKGGAQQPVEVSPEESAHPNAHGLSMSRQQTPIPRAMPVYAFKLSVPEFSVARGELVAVVGRVGAGKSALLQVRFCFL